VQEKEPEYSCCSNVPGKRIQTEYELTNASEDSLVQLPSKPGNYKNGISSSTIKPNLIFYDFL
jgi:hypothetical protein